MTTQQIANRLVELCEKGEFLAAQEELYSDDIVSIEQRATPGFAREIKGKESVHAKMEKFMGMVETSYRNRVSTPLVVSNAFAFILTMDVKMKEQERMEMSELCVYEVMDGKVISEHFFM